VASNVISAGTLLIAGAVVSCTISLRVQDNGRTADGGIDTSAPATVSLTVTEVNDASVANADSLSAVAEA
jgi:hypothetical protein